MQKTLRACVLMLALGCPTFAGIIHTPEPEPPPTADDGIIHGDNTAPSNGIMQGGYTDGLTIELLNALGSVLSLV